MRQIKKGNGQASERNRNHISRSYSDKIFDIVNLLVMLVLLVIFVWPLWFVVIASFSNPNEVWMGNVVLWPKGFTLVSYETLLEYKRIWVGYGNTLFYTVVGTLVNLVMTVCGAYPLSRKDFIPRHFFMFLFMLTMYFGGGLIPTYLVVNGLGLVDTRWAMIIPGAVSIYNIIITRTYFMNSIPPSLQEAATLDGANSFQYLMRVVLPLSKPIMAVIGLYYAVGHWNDFYTALIYLYKEELMPLQSFLRDMLMSTKLTLNNLSGLDTATVELKTHLAQTLKYSVIIVSTVPVLCIYPFIQKYFVKGVMVGSVKG
ncbi:MAG: carbohydrate ABC transporter permease [Lachnospiraceae bacterium]|jgi:putative aldouronate transport system permease protein|nr:carbohydrate ABC transporter permease [uncultured Acetatifactor sp.]MCI9571900.1 carbohydrate ABC transporter permease [Lachnospiraceae bacterium]